MNLDEFRTSPSGSLVPTVGGHYGFVPNKLPPQVDIRPLDPILARAHLAVGELRGVGKFFQNPYLLASPLQRSEALASSRMEGTFSSLEELALVGVGDPLTSRSTDALEVANYTVALEYGIARLKDLPISNRLILEIHSILLDGLPRDRTGGREPGIYRDNQNFIGKRGLKDISQARYVPPPPPHHIEAMADLETFLNADHSTTTSPLIILGLAHYQFEAIHPFPDGNGRVGRILMPLLLHAYRVLPEPFLYLSQFMEDTKDRYIDSMYNVSARGDWVTWLHYFLLAVEQSALRSIETINAIETLRKNVKEACHSPRSSALLHRVVDRVFEKLVVTRPDVASLCGITNRAAAKNIEKLEELGFLRELPRPGRKKYYYSPEFFELIR